MTARYHVAPDGYGDETIWREHHDDDASPCAVLSKISVRGAHRDELWALIVAAVYGADATRDADLSAAIGMLAKTLDNLLDIEHLPWTGAEVGALIKDALELLAPHDPLRADA